MTPSSSRSGCGSSPRSRGTWNFDVLLGHARRFIPALAGNIPWSRFWPCQFAVHPRARGEHGSPVKSIGPNIRFIPALAGNIVSLRRHTLSTSVHPRARGEHSHTSRWALLSVGSSPRSRGTSVTRRARPPPTRFIPALAGNIRFGSSWAGRHTVHPRARGEHSSITLIKFINAGSSPRSRGT